MATHYYSASIEHFLASTNDDILGRISQASDFSDDLTQKRAWQDELPILRDALTGIPGHLILEFIVPRIGSRIDAVVIVGGVIVVIEFKVGEQKFLPGDFAQAWDYALDLKNFHQASHQAPIVPILVATEAAQSDTALSAPHPDKVYRPLQSNRSGLRRIIQLASQTDGCPRIDPITWASAPYHPTPTIVEAAQALFAGHSVEAIARSEAAGEDLARTSLSVEAAIERARAERRKAIIFITGVPGAGKTLVGLNIATKRREEGTPSHAVFISGNGPLVAVLRAALKRDAKNRYAARKERRRPGDIGQEVKAFIQNVHHFRDEGINNSAAPSDHIVIFDEAQRAWNLRKTAAFMHRRKNHPDFSMSEPEFLISCLDRHHDWAAIVCLVGGGQEINDGEAGISAWLDALRERFLDWDIYISPNLNDSEYAAEEAIRSLAGSERLTRDATLHLATSVRSFRSESLSAFVKAVIDCDDVGAEQLLAGLNERYPVAVTRNLSAAKAWLREHVRGSERAGLLATSGAQRLRPHAIDVRVEINPVLWFLNGPDDVRSSQFLEDAATEFQVQGLELDWTCVTWDADLRFSPNGWQHHSFKGSRWQSVRQPQRQQYLRNAYRVLLTRARQGMVICVPHGDRADHTRSPAFYDATFNYLRLLGIREVA